MAGKRSAVERIRAKIGHPIIDVDAHAVELDPVVVDYVRQAGGAQMAERFQKSRDTDAISANRLGWYNIPEAERRDSWTMRPAWWGFPTKNTRDRATAALPRLLHERMDEIGLDFSIIYPNMGLGMGAFKDPELRQVACRAFNTFHAETFREYADRITPVAVIPMGTPQEAIAEAEHAVKVLGLKAIVFNTIRRPIAKANRDYLGIGRLGERLETFGIDAEYDYDPFWAKCVELGVVAATHSHSMGWGSRRSISNFMYNGSGHFAAGSEDLAKSLFMSGVTRRFPKLNFVFLEGGMAWAARLYVDMLFRWERRNPKALESLDPRNLDIEGMLDYVEAHGHSRVKAQMPKIRQFFANEKAQPRPPVLDEWAGAKIRKAEDVAELFTKNFYFGCEGEDPLNAIAFNSKMLPFGVKLKAVFGSDIGHWDVPQMDKVLCEAWELVERGLVSQEDFREFMLVNPVRLYAGMNPRFFEGTKVEAAARKVLGEKRKRD